LLRPAFLRPSICYNVRAPTNCSNIIKKNPTHPYHSKTKRPNPLPSLY
jgi:hypothetical protein